MLFAQYWKAPRSDLKPEPGSRTYAMMRRRASANARRTTNVDTNVAERLVPAAVRPRGPACPVLGPANRNGLLDEG